MQKRIIALAVIGLMSGAAFADTSVTIGGKYDAGYQFKHTANSDNADGTYGGAKTTETLGDGAASTSRITVQAKEDLMPGWNAMVDLDLRFGTVEEGKTGITSNDKKALYLTSPYGNLRWGVMNLVSQQYWDYEEKPYMVNVKDLEIVKYGIMAKRVSTLSSRATEYDTPVFNLGPVAFRAKANFVFGDNQTTGANNVDNGATGAVNGGNVRALAVTGAVGKLVNWTLSTHERARTTFGQGLSNGMHWQEHSISIHPIEGLKIGMNYNIYKGGDGTAAGAFKEKNTNFVVAYNLG
ncbi:porin, partial [Uliginosibacterium gangwonense]|uniref:porin n=1 Tax=Uliginosibacterium gangwonense TaxID=392736 RepID=UPI00035F4A4C